MNVTVLKRFFRDDQGQDLIEYVLLLAFVGLASAALFISAGNGIGTVWQIAINHLNGAANAASAAP